MLMVRALRDFPSCVTKKSYTQEAAPPVRGFCGFSSLSTVHHKPKTL